MWLRINLDGVALHLHIEDYSPRNKRISGDDWCIVEIALDDNRLLKWRTRDSILESCEVDDLRAILRKLINDELDSARTYECCEPDLTFVFYPKNTPDDPYDDYTSIGNQSSDVSMDLRIRLWSDRGIPSRNVISLNFDPENIKYLMAYLDLIAGVVGIDNTEIKAMIDKGQLYGELYKRRKKV